MGRTGGALSFTSSAKERIITQWKSETLKENSLSCRAFAMQHGIDPRTLKNWVKEEYANNEKMHKRRSDTYHARKKVEIRKLEKRQGFKSVEGNQAIDGCLPTLSRPSKCECKTLCGTDCCNREKMVECDQKNCKVGEGCGNRSIQMNNMKKIIIKQTEGKGKGAFAGENIRMDDFIIEYIGEVFTENSLQRRNDRWGESAYVMELKKGWYVDAERCGNYARYINHSCTPCTRIER